MFLPLKTDLPQRHTPYVNVGIIAATVLAFVAQTAFGPFNDLVVFDPADPAPWALVTSAFGHGGPLHLAFNMLFLWIFGNAVNDKLGNAAYLGFYLGAAAFGSLAHGLLSGAPVLGASGAVTGVSAMFVILAPRAKVTLLYFFFLIGVIEIPGLWFVGAFLVLDLLYLGSGDGVARWAHLGGAAYGAALGMGLLGGRLLPRDRFDALALLSHANRRRQFRDLANKGYDPFGPGDPVAAKGRGKGFEIGRRPDATPDKVHDLRAAVNEALAGGDDAAAMDGYAELRRVDERQVLSARNQVDVASLYKAAGRDRAAADAYAAYLETYPRGEQAEEVELLLGLLLARELGEPERAAGHLERAAERLTDPEAAEIARQVLAEVRGQPA